MDLNSPSAWSILLTQWLLVQLLTGLTIAFSQPYSKVRPAVTVLVIALAYSFQTQVHQTLAETRARGPLAAMCWVNVLNAIDLLMSSRVSFDEQIAWMTKCGQSKTADSSYWRRLVWSIEMAFNYRRINTPWQIRAVPAFDRHDPGFVPDKVKFLRQCALRVCGSLFVVHFCTLDLRDAHLAGILSEISDSKKVLLPTWGEWTARRAILQMLFTISFGLLTRAAILGTYSLLAMFFVAVGAYEPVDWPPVFGNVSDMYSLTRVWGIAWHQILRKLVTSNADILLYDFLRLPHGIVARSLRLIMAFATSGLVHFFTDQGFGLSLNQSGALWFFCLQVPGIALENLVWWTCRGMINRMGFRWRRAIGYVWVSLFFLWVTPVWMNPIILRLYQDGQKLVQPLCAPHLSVNISKKQSTLLQITKMRLPAIIPSALLGVAFVFAVIELGLGGHIASISTGSRKIPFYDPSSSWGYSYKTIKYSVPGIVAFQIFTSVWTMLVSVAAFLLPWFLRVKAAPGTRLNTIITGALGGAYFVTMVFWLACFADIATKLDELGATSDYYNAVIAFAVLSWLLFVALFVIVVLAILGILECDAPGYAGMRKRAATQATPMQTVDA
ncbi:hypothetical protein KXV70_004312 [Aspergillus fumigatus]|nr:hypothetical protein CNMCM8686_005662 [Aspergillus fumigatus]KAH1754568.1 hypothetical protein KXX09_004917 [Aspergillus fumigatus]KAH1958360.1 hypothetical protein KXV90_007505 [Aspergillus fumigatus]KAH2001600.1 hypothetical protein KXV80_001497 [Aspergillus fumigatus]KAH2011652.1 hypothetical protein KXV45_007181 [Aspergillus fumigatus]